MACQHVFDQENPQYDDLQVCGNGCGLTQAETGMVRALEFYASRETYEPVMARMGQLQGVCVRAIDGDRGLVARQALGLEDEVEAHALDADVDRMMIGGAMAFPVGDKVERLEAVKPFYFAAGAKPAHEVASGQQDERELAVMRVALAYCQAKLAAEQFKGDHDEKDYLHYRKRVAWREWRKLQDELDNIPPGFH